MKKQFLYHNILTALLTLVLVGCSTQKNTFVNRSFHNLTAEYNVYFNGNEAMKMGLMKVETRFEEDYTKILPIYKETLPGTESMISSDMTTAIEKGEKLIKLHSITKAPASDRKKPNKNRKEKKVDYNKWVDDAYIMMGRANLYKKEYIQAASIFTLIIRKFKNDPVKYNAYLWLLRTYSESERYTEALELVESLEGDNLFPKNLEGELAINAAELHLKQQHFDEAIQYLNIGIKKIKGNKRKTRYTFILAQIYQETGKNEQALQAYHQVIRRRPEYKMLFNARINSASVFTGEGNISELRKELNRMSKKKRNQDFLDQIYFALGNISYNEGKTDDAIELYKKSASKSVSNTYQRALSCITLGEIFFDQKKYIPSGNYYDSAMAVIDENYPNYIAVSEKNKSLSSLVTNLQMVVTQDSLQALAKLPSSELNTKIDGWILAATQKMADQESSSGDEYGSAYGYANSNRMKLGNNSSGWYFYNPSTISYGKKEFARMWGERKDEDDWRRKDKSISTTNESGEPLETDLAEEVETEEAKRAEDPTKREFYLQDIPSSDTLMAASHNKIRDALFNSGIILKTEFNDFENSVKCFRELDRRYPKNIYDLTCYFNLWDLYTTLNRPDSTGYFKNLIVTGYPESNYAKYLINPNYFIEEAARKDSINSLYNLAFNAYRNHDFSMASKYSNLVLSMAPDSTLLSKAEFIKTVADSRALDQQIFSSSLKNYLKKFPKAEPAPLAQQIIDLLKENKLSDYSTLVNTGYLNEVIKNMELMPQSTKTDDQTTVNKWDIDSELLHYFVIAIPADETIDINRLKYDIANYNIDNFTTFDFDIETENLNAENKLIVVRNFENKESAMVYFLSIIRKPLVFKTLAGKQFLNFIISNNNFREMLNDATYNNYLPFFVKNYSSRTGKEFNDSELESPEELMARLKQDENENLKEKGEFVEVKTSDANYQAPVQKEQLFKTNYTEPHSVMVVINEPRFKTGLFMREMVQYNNNEYRSSRLKVVPNNFKETTALLISSFGNGFDALEYLKKVESKKELFTSLGQTGYNCYVITNENLNKLKETNNFEDWKKFYQANYVLRRPTAPAKTTEALPEEKMPKIEEKKTAPKEKQIIEEKAVTSAVVPVTIDTAKTITPAVKAMVADTSTTKTTGNNPAPNTVSTDTTKSSTTTAPEIKTVISYSGPYVVAPESMHSLIYILPSSGSNKTLLTTYLNRLNAMKYRSLGYTVTVEEFNDFQSLVIVSGLGNSQTAKQYAADVNSDTRITMSLRNVNYRSYLITKENFQLLKSSKNIQEYQKFYEASY